GDLSTRVISSWPTSRYRGRIWPYRRLRKHQVPNTVKLQTTNSNQIALGYWSLEVGNFLVLGTWCLMLGQRCRDAPSVPRLIGVYDTSMCNGWDCWIGLISHSDSSLTSGHAPRQGSGSLNSATLNQKTRNHPFFETLMPSILR